MTNKQVKPLEIKSSLSSYLKQLAMVTVIISGVAKAAYTYYIEPKMNSKVSEATRPIKRDVMFIKILLEQRASPEDIKNATNRMEYLDSYKGPKH